MTFAVTPVLVTPQTDEGFPQFLQWQSDSADLGAADVDTVNVTGPGVVATRGVGEDSNVVTIEVSGQILPPEFAWVEAPGDYLISIVNRNGGIATTGTTGAQVLTVPSDTGDPNVDIPVGAAILIYQEGAASVEVVVPSGVTLAFRDVFLSATAGQFAILSLIKRGMNSWLLCGDMAAAP